VSVAIGGRVPRYPATLPSANRWTHLLSAKFAKHTAFLLSAPVEQHPHKSMVAMKKS